MSVVGCGQTEDFGLEVLVACSCGIAGHVEEVDGVCQSVGACPHVDGQFEFAGFLDNSCFSLCFGRRYEYAFVLVALCSESSGPVVGVVGRCGYDLP